MFLAYKMAALPTVCQRNFSAVGKNKPRECKNSRGYFLFLCRLLKNINGLFSHFFSLVGVGSQGGFNVGVSKSCLYVFI